MRSFPSAEGDRLAPSSSASRNDRNVGLGAWDNNRQGIGMPLLTGVPSRPASTLTLENLVQQRQDALRQILQAADRQVARRYTNTASGRIGANASLSWPLAPNLSNAPSAGASVAQSSEASTPLDRQVRGHNASIQIQSQFPAMLDMPSHVQNLAHARALALFQSPFLNSFPGAAASASDPNVSNASLPMPAWAQVNPELFTIGRGINRTHAASEQTACISHGVPIALPSDASNLSGYQCYVRSQIEFFEVESSDIECNAQGRNKPIVLGQVGIRCRHCAHLPPGRRPRGAVYFPSKLDGLYQAAQNMVINHFSESCLSIPPQTRARLLDLKEHKSTTVLGGGKQYWANGARILGVCEAEHGLRFEKSTTRQEQIRTS